MLAKTPMPKKKPVDPSELTPEQLEEISGGAVPADPDAGATEDDGAAASRR